MTQSALFTPITLRGVTLKNRIVELGIDPAFALAPVQHGHFLHRRALSGFTGSLSTGTSGMSTGEMSPSGISTG